VFVDVPSFRFSPVDKLKVAVNAIHELSEEREYTAAYGWVSRVNHSKDNGYHRGDEPQNYHEYVQEEFKAEPFSRFLDEHYYTAEETQEEYDSDTYRQQGSK